MSGKIVSLSSALDSIVWIVNMQNAVAWKIVDFSVIRRTL